MNGLGISHLLRSQDIRMCEALSGSCNPQLPGPLRLLTPSRVCNQGACLANPIGEEDHFPLTPVSSSVHPPGTASNWFGARTLPDREPRSRRPTPILRAPPRPCPTSRSKGLLELHYDSMRKKAEAVWTSTVHRPEVGRSSTSGVVDLVGEAGVSWE